ncbi:hypothetical protein TWF192_010927 [Orbilia oligospora]|uniref:Uncharacterized protein n=1 Tax=Orbilia oligospora TaxID=2813651 RepID=A0A6G1LYT4_ORBOL|nr:hypothetical protein TWF191_000451 [Orbilia oligospora]KAF3237390.1 hypothetical protein TWF192_010927 [Orbilia oligospora]
MSRGGGVRRPSISSPSQMENNPNIPAPPPSATFPLPSPTSASASASVLVSNPSNFPPLPSQPSSASSSQLPFTSHNHQSPNTPLASTDLTYTNGQAWNPINPPLLTTSSIGEEGTEYPFRHSPSEPGTPLHRRPVEYTASTVSANSAPPRSPAISQAFKPKIPNSSTSQHSRRSSHGRSSLGKVKAILKLPFIRRASSPNTTPTVPRHPETPLDIQSPGARSSHIGPPVGDSTEDNMRNTPGSPSSRTSLLNRRMQRNGGSVSGDMQPENMWPQPSALNPSDIHSSVSSIPPVMLTPPEDAKHVIWQPLPSTSQSAPRQVMTKPNSLSQQPYSSPSQSGADSTDSKDEAAQRSAHSTESPTADVLASVLSNGLESGEEWLKDALKVMLLSHPPDFRPTIEAVRLISHALPCPLPPNRTPGEHTFSSQSDSGVLPESASAAQGVAAAAGYFMLPFTQSRVVNGLHCAEDEGTTTALNAITTAIQKVHGNDTKRVYIHVSHAISSNPSAPKLQSTNLTGSSVNSAATSAGSLVPSAFLTSPPHERDFFSSTVFNSIVMAQDPISYAVPPGFPAPVLHRPAPNPALPPFSLHFSLLERYIPPATPTADSAMFSPFSSVLLDRVAELSPCGGSLLFVYPTKTGARQFLDRYLGKVLDPLLRRLMVLHRLRADLLWDISRMVAVETMQEFDDLKERLEHFCRRLSEKAKDDGVEDKRFCGPSYFFPSVSVVHAQKVNISLSQSSWREWWTFQESNRIREIVKGHFTAPPQDTPQTLLSESQGAAEAAAGSLSTAVYNGPVDLAREILDGVKALAIRPSSRGMGEAVFASSMVGPTSSWPIIGEAGSPNHTHKSRRQQEPETIEVGVFVLRRHG